MKNDEKKRKYIYYKVCFSIIVLFFIGILTSCNADDPASTELITSKVAGKIATDSGTGKISDLKNISVKLFRIGDDGTYENVSKDDAVTDLQGSFVLETDLDGVNNLLIKADRAGDEWKGILTSSVKSGIAVYLQPLDLVTTVATSLYEDELLIDKSIAYTRISSLIDYNIAATLRNDDQLINNVAEIFKSGLETEEDIFLRNEIGGTTSTWEQINSKRIAAQSALDRDLYYAGSQNSREIAFKNYLNSLADAYVEAGLQPAALSKVFEASIRVIQKGFKDLNPLYFDFQKRSSQIKARILNIAVQYEFQLLDADPLLINTVISSGDELENNLKNSLSETDIAEQFLNYRNNEILNLVRALGVNGNQIASIQDSIENYKTELISNVDKSDLETKVIDAYINFYENVKNLVRRQLSEENMNQVAVIDVLTLLNMYY